MAMRIWLIDDTPVWHQVTRDTLRHWSAHQFQSFHRGSSALHALEHLTADDLPHIILMDFYIGDERGDEVTKWIRQLHPQAPIRIIGYSTAHSGSLAIIQAGGNDCIRKHHDQRGLNPSLLSWLKSAD